MEEDADSPSLKALFESMERHAGRNAGGESDCGMRVAGGSWIISEGTSEREEG